jgi:hypothetical protein
LEKVTDSLGRFSGWVLIIRGLKTKRKREQSTFWSMSYETTPKNLDFCHSRAVILLGKK